MSLRGRFLVLRGLRWLPTGLLLPVLVLFILDRGFSLAQIGVAFAAQAVVVLLLELPTGGLADVIGARRVLAVANLAELASLALLLVAESLTALIAFAALQGLFRALESGPLDAWYVSAALRADPGADIEADMAVGGTVVGVAIASGSLAASGLVIIAPSLGAAPLALPLVFAVVLRFVELAALLSMTDDSTYGAAAGTGFAASVRLVPPVIVGSIRLVLASSVLAGLLGVELLWGMGMVGFETLFPPRLAEVLADPERAAGLLGPVGTAAWLLSAVGSALVPRLSRRLGAAWTGALLRVVQGGTVLGLAVFAGPGALIVAYLATMGVHGAANAVHVGILHANAESSNRTTVLSVNSMAAQLGGGIGGLALGATASSAGIVTAIVIGSILLAAAAPLYLVDAVSRLPGRAGIVS